MSTSGLVLFMCAGLLLSGGAILGGSTAFSLLRMSYYMWTTELGAELGACVLVVSAAALCLPTCWLATLVPTHPRSLVLISALMCLSTAALLLMSSGFTTLSGVSRALREPANLNASMLRAMPRDVIDPAVRSSFAAMQLELKCCGVQSYSDWYWYRPNLPAACCGRVMNGKLDDPCQVPKYKNGCLRPALAELRAFINATVILAGTVIVVLSVTLFAASYLLVSRALEREEARVLKQSLRVACLPPRPPVAPLAPLASLVCPAPHTPHAPLAPPANYQPILATQGNV